MVQFNSISDLHRVLGLPKPLHPLISLIDNTRITVDKDALFDSFTLNLYNISYKNSPSGKIKYGQNYYDFDEGSLMFTAPNQLMAVEKDNEHLGYSLLFHPDFIRNYPLVNNIKNFGFFSYSTNEALHLSEKEKGVILSIFKNVEDELQSPIDDFSQDVVVTQIELLLHYSNRFYKRQFITRKAVNNDLLAKLDILLTDYFNNNAALQEGIPTVQYIAQQLQVSPRYLSDMLRSLLSQNAQQYIQNKVIEKAKEMLSVTRLSVAEIAYQLGFEHPQSFNKLFKRKTNLSPLEFRQSFN